MIEKEAVPYWEIDELIDSYRLHVEYLKKKGVDITFWKGCVEGLTRLKSKHEDRSKSYIFDTTSAENP